MAAFYDKHARPYLSAKSRPTPPATQSQGSSTAGIVNHPEQWELLLPVGQSQSTIRGRNGSNSCTIISALFVRQCSSGTSNDQPDFSPQSLCKVMNDDNEVYESCQLSGLLSADEVLALQPGIGVKMAKEMFVHYDQLASVVRELVTESCTCHNYRSGCILVITPYSFSICCVGEAFILFDSHMHLASGALLARVSAVHAEHYLMHFFRYSIFAFSRPEMILIYLHTLPFSTLSSHQVSLSLSCYALSIEISQVCASLCICMDACLHASDLSTCLCVHLVVQLCLLVSCCSSIESIYSPQCVLFLFHFSYFR